MCDSLLQTKSLPDGLLLAASPSTPERAEAQDTYRFVSTHMCDSLMRVRDPSAFGPRARAVARVLEERARDLLDVAWQLVELYDMSGDHEKSRRYEHLLATGTFSSQLLEIAREIAVQQRTGWHRSDYAHASACLLEAAKIP